MCLRLGSKFDFINSDTTNDSAEMKTWSNYSKLYKHLFCFLILQERFSAVVNGSTPRTIMAKPYTIRIAILAQSQ